VIIGAHGIIRAPKPGHIVLAGDHRPFAARRIAEAGSNRHRQLSSPVSGGHRAGPNSATVVIAGGAADVFAK